MSAPLRRSRPSQRRRYGQSKHGNDHDQRPNDVDVKAVLAEHLHTRAHAGLFDVSHMGQALLEGPDHASTAAFLETLCPADLVNLAPGRQRYTQLLNDRGGIVDDLMAARPPGADGALRLVVNAARKAVDFALLSERLPKHTRLTPLREIVDVNRYAVTTHDRWLRP